MHDGQAKTNSGDEAVEAEFEEVKEDKEDKK
jgi:hypothetical protein